MFSVGLLGATLESPHGINWVHVGRGRRSQQQKARGYGISVELKAELQHRYIWSTKTRDGREESPEMGISLETEEATREVSFPMFRS